jgi:3-hydroxybutyryl-CoA dehydrogenase
MTIKNVSVIGCGQMGNGIAHVFAQNGFVVTMVDLSNENLDKAIATIAKNLDRMVLKTTITEEQKLATLANISTQTDIKIGVQNADLVVEAATENLKIKLEIFKQLDELTPAHTVLASNTSSISITQIAAATKRPAQVIGMHFMNPVPVMKLVEIIKGYSTSSTVLEAVLATSKLLGKTPTQVNDYPGFVSNRILMPMINEAIITLWEGVAGVHEIDTVMKLGMAHPMGPLQLADFIGLDTCLNIMNVLYDGFKNPKYAPCPLLVNMVMAKKYGVKSGEGFYVHIAGSKDLVVAPQFTV